jgi:hypothetical protein
MKRSITTFVPDSRAGSHLQQRRRHFGVAIQGRPVHRSIPRALCIPIRRFGSIQKHPPHEQLSKQCLMPHRCIIVVVEIHIVRSADILHLCKARVAGSIYEPV